MKKLHGNPTRIQRECQKQQGVQTGKGFIWFKRSPRTWFGRFTQVKLKSGYKQSQGDHALFFKHSDSGGVIILLIYADGIITTRNEEKEKQFLRRCLAKEFEIKEFGSLKYLLWIEVAHSNKGIFISQQKYVTYFLKETCMLSCKSSVWPIDINHRIGDLTEEPLVDKETYQRSVGKLIYFSHTWHLYCYRPNI